MLPAESALRAVQWVTEKARCPDVILADYRLREEHSGTNAVEEVQLACGRRTPAIILTGDTAPERIAEVQRSGFHIAHKPIVPDHLKVLVAKAVAHDA